VLDLHHEPPREISQAAKLRTVLGRYDEAELVTVITTAVKEAYGIGRVVQGLPSRCK
jgi:hypothetical protein